MLRAHRPHVNGFLSAQAAVILNLHARHVFQSIGYTARGYALELCPYHRLVGRLVALCRGHYLVQAVRAVGNVAHSIAYGSRGHNAMQHRDQHKDKTKDMPIACHHDAC